MDSARLSETTSLCGVCKKSLPAAIVRAGGQIFLQKRCDEHGPEEVLLSSSAPWYEETMAHEPALARPSGARPALLGCPLDCGPCEAHEEKNHLPVVPITSACDLDCPICYTHNKNEGAYHMPEEELSAILRHLGSDEASMRIINLTGGEPTLHPRFERVVEICAEHGVKRVTISTHGLRLLHDEPLCELLARTGARVILSFDSFTAEGNRRLLGGNHLAAKRRILDVLERHRIDTTLLPVLARGINDGEIGAFVELALSKDHIRSVEFHPMTFTGQSGATFDRAARYTTYDALADLERQTEGMIRVSDFVPSPLAHPLCYQVAYLLRLRDGRWLPFTRFMSRGDVRALLSLALYVVPGPEMERILGDVVNRLWAGEIACEDAESVLISLKDLVESIFQAAGSEAERLRVAEARTKAIYVHTHMDEETFDADRIRKCCVGMPGPDGSNIPSCAYNVLYRERDARFTEVPRAPLVTLRKKPTV